MRHVSRTACLALLVPALSFANECEVQSEDIAGFEAAIAADCATLYAFPGSNGLRRFFFPPPNDGDYRYTIDSDLTIMADDLVSEVELAPRAGDERSFGAFRITAGVSFRGENLVFREFGSLVDGGAIRIDDGDVYLHRGAFLGNWSQGFGGAFAAFDDSEVTLAGILFEGNRAELGGGAGGFYGASTGLLFANNFLNGEVGDFGFGHALDINTRGINENGVAVKTLGNSFASRQDTNHADVRSPVLFLADSIGFTTNGINAISPVRFGGTVLTPTVRFDFRDPQQRTADGKEAGVDRRAPGDQRTEAACNDFGSNAFTSLGYNISSDDSCNLMMPTDQPDTDPMMTLGADGWIEPMPGSPVIDGGVAELLIEPGNPLALAPCPTIDGRGTARPQDGDGDGNFECDLGAIEAVGTGRVVPGHSGAYFNRNRSGEGTYVEILSNDLAVVYTFSYRPDGSGPSWFVALANIQDNAIISLDVLRPTGASWGDDFDADDIDRDLAGAMNMVLPTCAVGNNSGNTVYTGNPEIGYEGLVSRTSRVSRVLGCNFTPVPDVGLSGSFFDPDRDGEGLIIQWLEDGRVLVIMFTFDPDGNQLWLTGSGTPNGRSVTIDVLYPAASTSWGRGFDESEIDLQPWGTFTLNWTSCNALTFNWDSNVAGFGSGSHQYQRLTRLANTSCPGF
ncbi:MAG: choice-of-anchor Q domain-containing protein [Pseudomonadota bacterium]